MLITIGLLELKSTVVRANDEREEHKRIAEEHDSRKLRGSVAGLDDT